MKCTAVDTFEGGAFGGPPLDRRWVTGMPADPNVIDRALHLVVKLAQSCVAGADGASVSLLRHGLLCTVAASNQIVMEMDAHQYATGEGPCVDAALTGQRVHAESLITETRWTAFSPLARSLGISAIFSSPLWSHDVPVGALNLFSTRPFAFSVTCQEMAAVFALKVSDIVSEGGVGVADSQMALRFQEALRLRRVMSLAHEVITEHADTGTEDLFTSLQRMVLRE